MSKYIVAWVHISAWLDLPTRCSLFLVAKQFEYVKKSIEDGFPEYKAMRVVVGRTFCFGPTRNVDKAQSSTINEPPARGCYEEKLFTGGVVKATRRVFLLELCVFHGYVSLALLFQKRGFFDVDRTACIAAVMNQREVFREPRLWYDYAVGCVPYERAADVLLCFGRSEILDDACNETRPDLRQRMQQIIEFRREFLAEANSDLGTANPLAEVYARLQH